MPIGQGIETNVDIVFVIDATASMQTIIDMVKASTLSFHENLDKSFGETGRIVNNLRVKVVWFRDFYFDGKNAYGESKFFELPEEQEDFHDFVTGINAEGGCDKPECALEALTLAMRSDFVRDVAINRHVIVLFTDAEAHAFEDHDRLVEDLAQKGCKPEMYPENMPKNLSEFYDAWLKDDMKPDALRGGFTRRINPRWRRLVLFAPDKYPWNDIEFELYNVIRKTIEAGKGGSELDMSDVYRMIASAI